MKKALSLLMSIALVLSLVPSGALAYSEAYGSEVWLQDTALHAGATLSDNIYWSHYYEQLRHEYFVTVSPNSGLIPVVAWGDSVCNRLTGTAAAKAYEAQGYRVVAGINGDYYDTATGFPLGLTISGGELLAGSGSNYAVGFRADGSVVIGEPNLSIRLTRGGESATVSAINRPRVEKAGITMHTYDFRTDHTTGATTSGVTALCTVIGGRAAVGSEMTVRVDRVTEGAGSVAIGENQVALTIASNGYTLDLHFMRGLMTGEMLTLSFSTADSAWSTVTESVGALYLLVKDGVAQEGFPTGYAPRSAVGVKANGEMVFYTVDGRQTEHSMGASLKILAQRMAELGCVTAVSLDGGGSTTLTASLPGSTSATVVNSPSDKAERKVSNHILLLARGGATGRASHVYLSADAHAVLPGHTVDLSASLVDTGYYPMNTPVSLTCSAGEINGTVFTAPAEGGVVTITATAQGMSASTQILVVDTPDEMHVYWDGAAVDSVTMVPGDTAELTVSASYNHLTLETNSSDFMWYVNPNLGDIDKNGVLTTTYAEGSGAVTVSKGALAVTIPLTLDGKSPFADTSGHWGVGYLCSLYHKGILTGVQEKEGLYAYPDKGVTRAEFAVLFARYLNLNTADYADVQTPFADMDKVDAWAADAVRAMYALGIVGGVELPDGTLIYSPQSVLTRSEAVTMLGRARKEPGISADLSSFPDAGEILPYAREHFETMVALGVMSGSYGRLNPNRAMTRAEICKVLATMP